MDEGHCGLPTEHLIQALLSESENEDELLRDYISGGIVTLAKNRPFSVDFAPTSRAPND
jgi:hypothetical protein